MTNVIRVVRKSDARKRLRLVYEAWQKVLAEIPDRVDAEVDGGLEPFEREVMESVIQVCIENLDRHMAAWD